MKRSGYEECYAAVKAARTEPVNTDELAEIRDKFGDALYRECLSKVTEEISNQKRFEELSEAECRMYYIYADMGKNETGYAEIEKAYLAIKAAFELYAKITGCHN